MSKSSFPQLVFPSNLGVDDKKVLLTLVFYEAGFFNSPEDSFVRKNHIVRFSKEFPVFMMERESQTEELRAWMQRLLRTDKETADKVYVGMYSAAKKAGLLKILRPKSETILLEAKKYIHSNSMNELDFSQILFDLKIVQDADKDFYRDLLIENGINIVDVLEVEEEIVEEMEILNETLSNKDNIQLFIEMACSEISDEKRSEIRDRLFIGNLRLVPFVLQKMRSFANYTPSRDADDDLQEGRAALLLAIDKFDVTKGNLFSTYAVQCIRGNILRFRNKNRYIQHVPENQNLMYQKANRLKTQREAELGREITLSEWAVLMDMPVYKLEQLVDIHQETTYFGSPVHSSSEDLILEEIISSDDNVEDEVMNMTLADTMSDALARLDSREEDIIRLRWGIFTSEQEIEHASMKLGRQVYHGEQITFDEIAKAFGITRERVRQILDSGLRKFRHPSISNTLLQYLEDVR